MAFLDKLIGPRMTLGAFMRSQREDDGLSLTAMAQVLGISRHQLQRVELEKRGVDIPTAIRWARRFGYDDLLFVELALQSQVDTAGLKLRVTLEAEARRGA